MQLGETPILLRMEATEIIMEDPRSPKDPSSPNTHLHLRMHHHQCQDRV